MTNRMTSARHRVFTPDTDNTEGLLQTRICDLLIALLERMFEEQDVTALVGGNQFIYYAEGRI